MVKDYKKFESALLKFIPWIREQIANSPDKIIRIKISDLKSELGSGFEKYGIADEYPLTDIYWGVKFVLQKYNIDTIMSITKDDKYVLSMTLTKDAKPLSSEIIKLRIEPKIPLIISPTEILSIEKRFVNNIIKRIEELKLPVGQNITVLSIMIEGAKLIIEQNTEVEDLLSYYHANEKIYYFYGILDALEKYNEITDFIRTYSTSDEEFKLYIDLYTSGVDLMLSAYESMQPIPRMKMIIDEIDNIIKMEETPKIVWDQIKYYIDRLQ